MPTTVSLIPLFCSASVIQFTPSFWSFSSCHLSDVHCPVLSHRMIEFGRDFLKSSGWVAKGHGQIDFEYRQGQPPWATCASSWSPLKWKSVSLMLKGNSCVSVCPHCFWSCYWAPPERAWIQILCILLPDVYIHLCTWDTTLLSPHFSGLNSFSSLSHSSREQPLHYLHGHSLGSLPYVHVSAVVGSP